MHKLWRVGPALIALVGLFGCRPRYIGTETDPTRCANGVDDDGDLLVDCADPGCATSCGGSDSGIPPNCGDGVVDPGEECDLLNLGGSDCTDFGYDGGTLT